MTGFDLSGGGGSYFSFGPQGSQPGAHVAGLVLDMKEVQSTDFKTGALETWDNGDPKMQYKVTLQTELRDDAQDDGKRDIYLDGRRKPYDDGGMSKLCAVLEAVRTVTGTTSLQPNGKLTLQWVSGLGISGDPRRYQAWYEAPAMALGQPGTPPPPPGVAQQAPPAAPPAQVQQQIPTEQGPVNPSTGEVAPPPPTQAAPPAAAPPAQAPAAAPPAAAAPAGPTDAQVAALRAAGVDPATVFPGFTG